MRSFFLNLLVIISSFLLWQSCASKKAAITTELPKVYYPEEVDSAKIQYLTSFTTSFDIEKKQSKFNKALVGDVGPRAINKGYGVEYHDSKIYVADIGIAGFDIIDLKNETFTYFVPQGRGKLKGAVNSCLDDDGTLYVADIGEKKIAIYNKDLMYMGQIGAQESVAPSDVNVTKDKVWVLDSKNNRVNVYNKTSKAFLYYFPELEEGDEGWLYSPTNFVVSKDKVYVSDMGDGSVKTFTHTGELLNVTGSFGVNEGQFIRPKGIAADLEGNIYVVDASFQNVQIFNKEGQLLLFFGGPTGDRGGLYLPTSIAISYDVKRFVKYVDPRHDLKYLIFVINQFGPYKLNVYGRVELKQGK